LVEQINDLKQQFHSCGAERHVEDVAEGDNIKGAISFSTRQSDPEM